MAMNAGMKMMLMGQRSADHGRNQSEYGANGRRMIGYDRETNGRGVAAYGDYGVRANDYTEGYGRSMTENRRRRDSRGRYMESEGWEDNASDGYTGMRSGGSYEDRSPGTGDAEIRRRHERSIRRMNEGEEEGDYAMKPSNYGGDIYAHGTIYAPNAMNRPTGGASYTKTNFSDPVDERTARKWVKKMDGGEYFDLEDSEQMREEICPECRMWEFYVAINAMHSDFCATAKSAGMDTPEFYAHLAKDFLMDKDAKPNKLRLYMETIPK